MELSDTPRARFLLQALSGTDSAITVEPVHGSPILLHIAKRDAHGVTATMARNDGIVGVARAEYDAGATVRSYDATWADTGSGLLTRHIVRSAAGLVVSRTGTSDTTVAVPEGRWGIADFAMEELLVPLLQALPRDGAAHPLAVYRPFPGYWDAGTVTARERGGMTLLTLLFDKQSSTTVVLTPDGDYLYAEHAAPASRRIPMGAARQARLREFFAKAKGGG